MEKQIQHVEAKIIFDVPKYLLLIKYQKNTLARTLIVLKFNTAVRDLLLKWEDFNKRLFDMNTWPVSVGAYFQTDQTVVF